VDLIGSIENIATLFDALGNLFNKSEALLLIIYLFPLLALIKVSAANIADSLDSEPKNS